MILLCCPYCLAVFDVVTDSDAPHESPELCAGCGRDPRRDAAIELRSEDLESLPRTPCARCEAPLPTLAVCCARCGAARAPTSRLVAAELLAGMGGGRLVAQCRHRVAFHDAQRITLVDFSTDPPQRERELEVAWQRSVAISFTGSLAFVAEDGVHLAAAGRPNVSALGAPGGVDVEAVGFVGETPIALPSVRSEDDDALVPWLWRGGSWQPTGLPVGEGWTSSLDLWELHGCAVPLAEDQACVVWDGRVYIANEASALTFHDMAVTGLRTEGTHSIAPFGGDVSVISAGRLVRIGVQGLDASFASPSEDVRQVLPAPYGAVLAWCKDLGNVVVWPDGPCTRLDDLLGSSGDQVELFAVADRICLLDRSRGTVSAASWSDFAAACGRVS